MLIRVIHFLLFLANLYNIYFDFLAHKFLLVFS